MLNREKLYVTDLDGTLLNSKCIVSSRTIELLNNMIEDGLKFSVATARSAATCQVLLREIKLDIPIILMNGVFIYNIAKDRYIDIENIGEEDSEELIKLFSKYDKYPFMYKLAPDQKGLEVFYRDLINEFQQKFYDERAGLTYKKFEKTMKYPFDLNTVYFVFIDKYEELLDLKKDVDKIYNLKSVFYKDIYSNYWYLEIFSKNASKANAVQRLKKIVKADKLVCFGDNHNDVEMFKVADECYAVENAVEILKKSATEIIAANDEDSVALKIKSMFEKN